MGIEESLPLLPEEIVKISMREINSFPKEYDQSKQQLKYQIPPNHKIETIILFNAKLSSFPTDIQNLKSLILPRCNLNSKLNEIGSLAQINFPSLALLNLNENNFDTFPSFIYSLPKLEDLSITKNKFTKINVQANEITEFPKNLCESVIELNIGFNKLQSFENIENSNLLALNISGNNLISLGPNCTFSKLQSLDVSHNKLVEINNVALLAPSIHSFKCQFNYLISFPTKFPPSIEFIDVDYNIIQTFPESLANLTNLKDLFVAHNEIQSYPEFPPNIDRFLSYYNNLKSVKLNGKIMKHLNFENNELEDIPDGRNCVNATLELCNNKITEISTSKLSHKLKLLNVSYNNLHSFNPKIIKTKLRRLLLIKCGLTKLPRSFAHSILYELNISENYLGFVPHLPQTLKVFRASNCGIRKCPDVFSHLYELEIVDLSENFLEKINRLPNCKYLNLSMNKLTKLPRIPDAVKIFEVSHNKLTEFIFQSQLESIDVSHNNISNFEFEMMPNLHTLKIAFNPTEAPIQFHYLPNLKFLDHTATHSLFPFPIPNHVIEIISSATEIANIVKNGQLNRVTIETGYSEDIGIRPSMEDAIIVLSSRRKERPSLFAVIDGHGGRDTASLAANFLPKHIWRSKYDSPTDLGVAISAFLHFLEPKNLSDGATIGLIAIKKRDVGICSLGDTRIVLVKKNGSCIQLTNDHKSTEMSEIEIVKSKGGFFTDYRLANNLAVTRSLGDFFVHGINHEPDISHYTIDKEDYRIVIGCDGVFDVMSNEDIASLCLKHRNVHKAASAIKNTAIHRNTGDNVSVIVINVNLKDSFSIPNIG